MAQRIQATQFGTVLTSLPDAIANERFRGLSGHAAALLSRAGCQIESGDYAAAGLAMTKAMALAPEHPEILRLHAVLSTRTGGAQRAIASLRRVLSIRPDDVLAYNDLGDSLRAIGDRDAAYAMWHRACERVPDSSAAWFNLGWNLERDGHFDGAWRALERALALAPDLVVARMLLADVLLSTGEIARAAAEYRTALRADPAFGEAWLGLANIRSVRFDAAEIAQMEQVDRRCDLDDQARAALEFALGKAYEDEARYADAFAMLTRANAIMRRLRPWDAAAFSAHVDEVVTAFSRPVARAEDAVLGHGVIFIVGMPRSGTTLTEQILAAHAQVEGGGELPDLMQVIREESARRRSSFPHWVAAATGADWTRLGQRYLERTARWRERKPWFTDKQPYNWLLAGAALAMLPGARVIECRRDPLETCWSCFQQMFPQGAPFSYDLHDIADFHRAHDRAARVWTARHPERVLEQSYETLVADTESQVRALLEFCGLPFDAACLEFHRSGRAVHTASAGQVRQPIRRDTARASNYGELLDALRRALDAD